MLNKIKGLFVEEKGQGMTEYGLILGLIAVGVIAVLVTLGGEIKAVFEGITGKFTPAE
ncbi:pilus assembly protein Flp/PilA [Oceanobacillus limi]|uniref:Pilus assembly protein Flp/PilA n=1 Tax=Oceanobacillus limi TaxID=930131 RepID=A0A1I0BG98_9BACI|nr:Flp family type IVb pilin [Oceanobacillus limi]SET05918.1 pilus assembly protein Flp/PilA [Oceanobacillus limi]SET05964.1 pilus assembly protein Flp/PilA [Oceanobacillus limi]